jgi:hypothetical protein
MQLTMSSKKLGGDNNVFFISNFGFNEKGNGRFQLMTSI